MRRMWGVVLLTLLLGTLGGGVTAALAIGEDLVPPITVPEVTVPDLTVPDVTLPVDTTVPVVTVPVVTVPEVTIPEVTVPTLPTTLPTIPTTLPTTPGGAVGCADFLTQAAAQAAMLADPGLAAILDPDRDGAACELLPKVPPGVVATSAGGTPAGGSVAGSTGDGAAITPGLPLASTADSATSGVAAEAPTTVMLRNSISRSAPRGSTSVGGTPTSAEGPLRNADHGTSNLVLELFAFALLLAVAVATAREAAKG